MDISLMEFSIFDDECRLSMFALEHETFINIIDKDNDILNESVNDIGKKIIETIGIIFKKFIELVRELIKKTKELFRTIRSDIVKKINNYIDNNTYKDLKKKYDNGKYTKSEFAYYLYYQKYENNKELYAKVDNIFKDKYIYPSSVASEIYHYFNNNMKENTESLSDLCATIDVTFREIKDIMYYRKSKNSIILADYKSKIEDVKGFIGSLLYNHEKNLDKDNYKYLETKDSIEEINEGIVKYIDKVSDKEKQITDPLSELEDDIHKSLIKLGKVNTDKFIGAKKEQFNDIIKESRELTTQIHDNISGVWELTKYIIQTYKDLIVKNVQYSIATQRAYDEIIKFDEANK